MTEAPKFSVEQAQRLINIARAAPLQNMAHADSVNALLTDFQNWFNWLMEMANKPPAPPQDPAKIEE